MLVHLRWAWEFREGMPIPIIVPQASANAAPPRIPRGSAMNDQEPPEREVAEAVAAYGTAAAALRATLERIAARYPVQPCRVVEAEAEGEMVVRLEYWGPAPDNSYERWLARCERRPHPPRPARWRKLRALPVGQEWTAEAIDELEAEWLEACDYARRNSEWHASNPAEGPPGYEDDYDLDDWFYDLKRGFA